MYLNCDLVGQSSFGSSPFFGFLHACSKSGCLSWTLSWGILQGGGLGGRNTSHLERLTKDDPVHPLTP